MVLALFFRSYLSSQNNLELIIVNKEPIFYSYHGGPYLPTMKVLLRGTIYNNKEIHVLAPDMMKSVQVDKGAIKFVLSGANIMCRGLTSPGGRLPDGLKAGEPVVWVRGVFTCRPFLQKERSIRLQLVSWLCLQRRCMIEKEYLPLDVRRMRELELLSAII